MADYDALNEGTFNIQKDQTIESLIFDPSILFSYSGLTEATFKNLSMFEELLIHENVETLPFKVQKDVDNVALAFITNYTTQYYTEDVMEQYSARETTKKQAGIMIPPNIIIPA